MDTSWQIGLSKPHTQEQSQNFQSCWVMAEFRYCFLWTYNHVNRYARYLRYFFYKRPRHSTLGRRPIQSGWCFFKYGLCFAQTHHYWRFSGERNIVLNHFASDTFLFGFLFQLPRNVHSLFQGRIKLYRAQKAMLVTQSTWLAIKGLL